MRNGIAHFLTSILQALWLTHNTIHKNCDLQIQSHNRGLMWAVFGQRVDEERGAVHLIK